MADLMDLYKGLGPGMGAYFEGQNQGNNLLNDASRRELTGAQTQDLRGRLQMAQEMHPLEMERTRSNIDYRNQEVRGIRYTNDINDQVGVSLPAQALSEEKTGKMAASKRQRAVNFLGDVVNGMPLDQAIQVHGVDPNSQTVRDLSQMTPQQRAKIYEKVVTESPTNLEHRAAEAAKAATAKATQEEISRRELEKERMRAKAKIEAAKIAADKAAQVKNYMHAATYYKMAADAALDAGDEETYRNMFARFTEMAQLNDQNERVKGEARAAGDPNLNSFNIDTRGDPRVKPFQPPPMRLPNATRPGGNRNPEDEAALQWYMDPANKTNPNYKAVEQKLKQLKMIADE